MTKRLRNTKRSTGTTVTVLLLAFLTLPALALGGALTVGSAFGASLAPAPKISSAPPAATASKRATFAFSHARPRVKFLCKLDAGRFVSCARRKSYARLGRGKHTFRVRAAEGKKRSRTASFSWKVVRPGSPILHPKKHFTISGDAAGPIYPGGQAQPILVTLHNPNSVSIVVTSLVVSANTNAPGGCRADTLRIQQANLATATKKNGIAVPAKRAVTLPAQGVAPPTIRLVDTGVDQTADCANQTFSLTFTGSAHS